jgi:hypothetical protein
LLPAPFVHPDLAAAATLAAADEDRSAPVVKVVLGQRQASWMRKPARQRTTITARSLQLGGRRTLGA